MSLESSKFKTKVISANRITIPKQIVSLLEIKEGKDVIVTIEVPNVEPSNELESEVPA